MKERWWVPVALTVAGGLLTWLLSVQHDLSTLRQQDKSILVVLQIVTDELRNMHTEHREWHTPIPTVLPPEQPEQP